MRRSSSLAARVVLVCVLTTIAGALLTSVVAGIIAERLVTAAEDERLRGSARGLGAELGAELDENDTATAEKAHEEAEEVEPAGLHLTIFKNGHALGGSAEAIAPPLLGCARSLDAHAQPIRVCAESAGPYVVAYWSSTAEREAGRNAYVAAVIAAMAIAALAALAVSRSLAAWAVRPLSHLREAIDAMSREHPRAIDRADRFGVPEVVSIANALNDLVNKLAASLSESRRFAAGAAHELRTPLATISAELELLAETTPDPSALQRMHRTVSALSSRVDNLLVLATVHDNMQQFLRDAVAMSEVIDASVAMLPAAHQQRVHVDSDDSAATVRGDATLLQMAIGNAIDNALKFSGHAPVVVHVRANDDRIVCEVRDTGPGVPLSERERVFDPFYRAAAVGANGVRGYGLGLALIAHVMRAHGGSATFAEVSEGAVLRLELPLWRA